MRWFAPSFGNQPLNSVMRVKRIPGSPPGHPTADGWFKIKYVIPSGIQTVSLTSKKIAIKTSKKINFRQIILALVFHFLVRLELHFYRMMKVDGMF